MTIAPVRPGTAVGASAPAVAAPGHAHADCPPFCDGSCTDQWTDVAGARYHGGILALVSATELNQDRDRDIYVTASRLDEPGKVGDLEVHLLTGGTLRGEDWKLDRDNARDLGHMLIDLANSDGPFDVNAEDIRVGDVLVTGEGQQKVYMLMVDASSDHVSAYTHERNDSFTDGWQFVFGEQVTVVRVAR